MNYFKKCPRLPLILLNLLLAGLTWLFFLLVVGVGIGENYHPDSVSRSLLPLATALFVPTALFFLGSLLSWFKWRKLNTRKIRAVLFWYVVILIVAGGTTYLFTEKKPEYRTYEHNGYVYEIPRVYSPNQFWGNNLSIDVCSNSPLIGEYDRTAQKQKIKTCEQGTHVLEPVLQSYSQSSGDIAKRELVNGTHGFTIATTTDSLVLSSVDVEVLKENKVEQIIEGDQVIFRSTLGGLHKRTYYLEFVGNELRWMTICNLWNCRNYSPLPNDETYMLRVAVYNEKQYERGFLTDEEIAEYKLLTNDVYGLFKSFRVN